MTSYSDQIGNMMMDVAGDSPNSSWIVALFLLGAFAFLSYKRGYSTLATGMVMFPTAVAICVGDWLPDMLQGIALICIGVLWGFALIKLMGSLGENSDIQKFFMICMCVNAAMLLSGFGDPALAAGNSQVSGILGRIASFVFLGGIVGFLTSAGIEQLYIDIIKIPLITAGALAIVPFLLKIIAVVAQLGIKGVVITAGLAAVGAGLFVYFKGMF